MKCAIVPSVLSLILFCDRAKGDYSLLQKKFDIQGPVHTYEALKFTMAFEISDLIEDNMIEYSLYDGHNCKDGGDNDITDNDGYLLHRIRTDNTPPGDGSGTRSIKIASQIVLPDIINSTVYTTDSDDNGVVKYCVRMGVYNMDRNDPMSMEVNFLEIPIKLTLRTSSGFAIDAALSNINPMLDLASQGTAVEAYICDYEDNIVPIMPTEQGQTIRVCVTPVQDVLDYGGRMRHIEQFEFFRQVPIVVKQSSINPNTDGAPADQLTVVQCRPGSIICAFETLLNADFFTEPGIVFGQGLAYLQLGDGETSTERRMQELSPNEILRQKPTAFQLKFSLQTLESLGMTLLVSNAPTAVSTLMTTVILGASLTLLLTDGFFV